MPEGPDRPADAQHVSLDGHPIAIRLRRAIPRELFRYFDLYLYVNKAAHGRGAQRMVIFHKDADGKLVYERALPVSTGRERREAYFTDTPAGIFQLDPARFERMHYSREWNGAPMPWTMFFKYNIHGHQTGIALHAAPGREEAHLGHRASGGCIRLPMEAARVLFHRIQREEGGLVPVFALDEAQESTGLEGVVLRDAAGRPVLTEGLRVLILVQKGAGGRIEVAELS